VDPGPTVPAEDLPVRTLTGIFKALSDETRLRMLALLLRRGELCVCDFVEALGITQSKASRHLRYLAHAGLASDRRDAVWVHYRIPERMNPEAAAVLEALRPLLASRDIAEDERRLDAWRASRAPHPACRRPLPGIAMNATGG